MSKYYPMISILATNTWQKICTIRFTIQNINYPKIQEIFKLTTLYVVF